MSNKSSAEDEEMRYDLGEKNLRYKLENVIIALDYTLSKLKECIGVQND